MSRRGAVAPLALPPAPSGSVLGGRLDHDCVDSLPYADVLPQGWRDAAEALVREELRRSDTTVDNYVAQLAPVPALHFKARHNTLSMPPLSNSASDACLRAPAPAGVPIDWG